MGDCLFCKIAKKEIATDLIYENKNIKWLYCVPKYPCSLTEINFKNFVNFDGYSNHCPNIMAPLTSIILGGKIIEVHVTLDKSKDHIDNPVSFDLKELSDFVKFVRKTEKIKI